MDLREQGIEILFHFINIIIVVFGRWVIGCQNSIRNQLLVLQIKLTLTFFLVSFLMLCSAIKRLLLVIFEPKTFHLLPRANFPKDPSPARACCVDIDLTTSIISHRDSLSIFVSLKPHFRNISFACFKFSLRKSASVPVTNFLGCGALLSSFDGLFGI